MRVWIDIDNPPQVQYLVPLAAAFERAGFDIALTARNFGITVDLLTAKGVDFTLVGERFGRSRTAKATGLVRRACSLTHVFTGSVRPDVLVAASRSAALSARLMRKPAFILCDYEHVHLGIYRALGSNLLFPDAIDQAVFVQKGFPQPRLFPFRGLKEDITFAGVSIESTPAHTFSQVRDGHIRVLFRPSAEESHYHVARSRTVALELLEWLAAKPKAVVIFSPRYDWQLQYAERLEWVNEPILLERPVSPVPLLKAVDLVVSAGGTMLREAAYLGIPAYSAFQGPLGGVDRYLEAEGRLHVVSSSRDFAKVRLERTERKSPLNTNPSLAEQLVDTIAAVAA